MRLFNHFLKGYNGCFVYSLKKYPTETILLFNDNVVSIKIYQNVFTTCICDLLIHYTSISKQTNDTYIPWYCKVKRHVAHSYGQALIYIQQWHEAEQKRVYIIYCMYVYNGNIKLKYKTYKLTAYYCHSSYAMLLTVIG